MNDGASLHAFVARLLDIPRSLTGDGVRQSLAAMAEHAPFTTHEVPTGTEVFDWTVPNEWNCRGATLTGPDGTVVADTRVHPLHVLGYSEPTDVALELDDLQPHLHSLPDNPSAIPYRTSYYNRTWGFCLTDEQRRALPDGQYRAEIDSDLAPGSLSYAEAVFPGTSDEVVLVTTHTCHPGMANDNASGMAILTGLAAHLDALPERRRTWHLVAAPGTIGALTWLAQNPDVHPRVVGGVTLAGIGDRGPLNWKRTFVGDTWVDQAAVRAVEARGGTSSDFSPWGYDERQYNAPGFRLPVGHLGRTPHGTYPEYHTSLDNLDFVTPDSLGDALACLIEISEVLDGNRSLRNLSPYGEPRLGPRGLYPSMGGQRAQDEVLAMLWVLTMADGAHSLLETADRSGIAFAALDEAATKLAAAGLVTEVTA